MCGYAPRTLQDAFKRTLTLETGLQLAKGVHLGRSPQMMQVPPAIRMESNGVYTKSM